MEEKYRRLLRSCDEKGAYEYPTGFDYDALKRDALAVQDELCRRLGLQTRFEGAESNQDASFSIAIILVDYVEQRKNIIFQPTVLFSNFGRLVTLTWSDLLPQELPERTQVILGEHGFHFVPDEVMDTDYDGVMAGDKALRTWWIRYFSWL